MRVAVHGQEQRMPAAQAGVFVVAGALVDAQVGVMAQQAAQDVAGVGDPPVLEEEPR